MDQPVIPFYVTRLLWGSDPALYYLEIVFRTGVIYVWTLALVRWIGGRSVSQLSLVDFVLVIALGSAVGDSVIYADLPLAQAMLVVALVVGVTKGLEWLIHRYPRAETLLDDAPVEVIRDGAVILPGLAARNLAPGELYEMLRLKEVSNLGEIRRAYVEGGGAISILRYDQAQPGLALIPPPEIAPPPPVDTGTGAGRLGAGQADLCCIRCGARASVPNLSGAGACCAACGHVEWTLSCLGARL